MMSEENKDLLMCGYSLLLFITACLWLIPSLPASMMIFIIMIVKPISELYIRWRYDNSYTQILSLEDDSSCDGYFVGETLYLYLNDPGNLAKLSLYTLISFAITIIAHVTHWLEIRCNIFYFLYSTN